MLKEALLRHEYDRIISSGEYFYSAWRESYEVFRAALWDMTPTYGGKRDLAPIDPALDFSPGNVEFQFKGSPKVRAATRRAKPGEIRKTVSTEPPTKPTRLSSADKKAIREASRLARRQELAAEFQRWNELRASGGKYRTLIEM